MHRKLGEIYSLHRPGSVVATHGLSPPLDCTRRWALRTQLYDPTASTTRGGGSGSASTTGTGGRPEDACFGGAASPSSASGRRPATAAPTRRPATGVPKSLGFAKCAGCGVSSGFYRADGVALFPCTGCHKVSLTELCGLS